MWHPKHRPAKYTGLEVDCCLLNTSFTGKKELLDIGFYCQPYCFIVLTSGFQRPSQDSPQMDLCLVCADDLDLPIQH